MLEKISNFKYLARVEKYYHYLKKLEPSKYSHFLKKEYQKRTGEKLELEQPKKYTEKMQYAKIYLNTPLKTKLSDKLSVREWIENEIGNEYLIPLLGVWDKFSDINIKELPNHSY